MELNNEVQNIDDELNQVIKQSLQDYDDKYLQDALLQSMTNEKSDEDIFEKAIQESIKEYERKLKIEEDRLIREEQDREFAESLEKLIETPIHSKENINDDTNNQTIEEDIKTNLNKNELREARLKYFIKK